MNEKKTKYFSPERKSRIASVLLLAITISVMIFIVTPFEIYCNNIAELTFSISDFILLQTLLALALSTIIFALLFFVPLCVYRYLYPALVGVLVMFFVQGNYLNGSMTSLAGDQLSGGIPISSYVINTLVWVIVIAGCIVCYRLIKQRSTTRLVATVLSIAIFATQLMNFTVCSLTTEGAYDSAVDRVYGQYSENPRFLTNKEIGTVGSKGNVIVICVDRFDTLLYVEPAMEKYPEAFAPLDGFTFYRDAISLYGYTFPSVAYMMSSIEYDHSGDRRAYFDRVYNQNQTISRLHELGYSVHLYSDSYYDYSNANELPSYVENTIEADRDSLKTINRFPDRFALAITKMSLYRIFPFLLKSTVGGVSSDTCNEYILYTSEDLGGYREYTHDTKKLYEDIKSLGGVFETKGEKNFTFIHFNGCHDSLYDENFGTSGKRNPLVSAKNSMKLIALYLDGIKSISPELYRDSTIIIMGDHGKVEDRMKDFTSPMLAAIFVKPSGESGTPLKISDAPVAQENLWATIFESEGIDDYDRSAFAPSIFEIEREFDENGTYPERKFIWTKRRVGMTTYSTVEYKIVGPARDFSNWTVTERNHYDHPLFN